jgi:putative molybdenum carrier protein
VRESDGTLIITRGEPDRGTALTRTLAQRYRKPLFLADLDGEHAADEVQDWVRAQKIRVLNIAGPRESSCKGIWEHAYRFLREVLK